MAVVQPRELQQGCGIRSGLRRYPREPFAKRFRSRMAELRQAPSRGY
jgi:hypothetical protein